LTYHLKGVLYSKFIQICLSIWQNIPNLVTSAVCVRFHLINVTVGNWAYYPFCVIPSRVTVKMSH